MWLFLIMGWLPGESADDIFFKGSISEVLAKAKSENKLVMVDVYTTWCGPCKLMDRTTFSDRAVQELLTGEKLIAYKVDAERGEGVAFSRKYGVRGFPCTLILDGDGKLINRKLGYQPARAFINFLTASI